MYCSVEGCQRPAYTRTWCNAHYVRWQKYGDVTVDLRAQRRGESARFWALVEKTENCWKWVGTKSRSGYGKFWTDDGRTERPHRWAYRHEVGPIPTGLTLDHTCHSKDQSCPGGPTCPHRACVRPNHLEPVTGEVNTGRGGNAQKTHCRNGHEYTPENTYRIPPNPSTPHGGRSCKTCRAANTTRHAAKRAAERGPIQPRPLKTHCKQGHEFTPENTYVMPGGGRSCRQCRNAATKASQARKKRGEVERVFNEHKMRRLNEVTEIGAFTEEEARLRELAERLGLG